MKTWKDVFQHLLFVRHVEWARKWVAGWVYNRRAQRFQDDLENIALIALWHCCEIHNPDEHTYEQFFGLATKMMDQRMCDFMRREWLEARHMKCAGQDSACWDLIEGKPQPEIEPQEVEIPIPLLYFPTARRCREAAYLYFFVGMTMREIGVLMNCSGVQVHRLLRYGLTMAREKLGISDKDTELVVVRKPKH